MITGIVVANKVHAMRRALGLALLILAGCPADDQTQPDAPAGAGVAVAWVTDPATVPGRVEDGYDLTAAVFHLRNLRVVGDAGAGDPRTTTPLAELGWSSESRPGPIAFPDAPPGLYSRMLWTIDRGAGRYAWELHGTAQTSAGREPYAILDDDALPIDLDYQIMAEAGTLTTIVTRTNSGLIVAQRSACSLGVWARPARPRSSASLSRFCSAADRQRLRLALVVVVDQAPRAPRSVIAATTFSAILFMLR
jgi:hypothetical protein